ncbi:MAG: AraC family transcriptional regulator [Opitutaceae bacterium]|nr:AraC family transcriptional regulator [Opitutaceae bacterium]
MIASVKSLEPLHGKPECTKWEGPHFRPLFVADYVRRDGVQLAVDNFALAAIEPHFIWRMTIAGQAWLEHGERRVLLEPGSVFSAVVPIPARIIAKRDGTPWRSLHVSLGGARAIESARWVLGRLGMIQKLPLDPTFLDKTQGLIQGLVAKPGWDEHDWSSAAYDWFQAWWRLAEKQGGPATWIEATASGKETGTGAFSTVKEFAAKLGYSPSYLSRKITAAWNKSPGKALRDARMQEAARLLVEESLSVQQISQVVGYATSGSFVRAFRREFGLSPLVYRHSRRAPIQDLSGGTVLRELSPFLPRLGAALSQNPTNHDQTKHIGI